MKVVADESVEGQTVAALRAAGYDVHFIAEVSPGIDDSAVLDYSRRENALLVTADKDFGELIHRDREAHCGVLLIRAMGAPGSETAHNVVLSFDRFGSEMPGCFPVLMGATLRIRKPLR